MECRRINTTVISFDYENSDTLKRNQYLTVINCKLPKKESNISNIFKVERNSHFYYGTITNRNTIIWFSILSTSSYLGEYNVVLNQERTNILYPIINTDNSKQYNENPSESTYALNNESILIFTTLYIIICTCNKILIYDNNGIIHSVVDIGIDKVSSIYATLCNTYLFINFEKGIISLYSITKKEFIYRKKHLIGESSVFGNVFRYLRYFTISKNTLIIGRVRDGSILLELSYPEELSTVSTDILQKRVVVGSVTGTIYHTRLDNLQSEFSSVKLSNSRIKECFFSNSGRYIFSISDQQIFIIDAKNGKTVKTLLNPSLRNYFTFTSSSNLHFQ
ncbi:hypothetical protein NEIRO03_2316 [Nematocida sp. AWRm78]|nr:hypothetical protein NEIRO02_2293 [Nematocida sp. AWRm79]KAI5186547.1 hypothetical protein NEIRO03_2316 [Nematocida sp. AWRm78]